MLKSGSLKGDLWPPDSDMGLLESPEAEFGSPKDEFGFTEVDSGPPEDDSGLS